MGVTVVCILVLGLRFLVLALLCWCLVCVVRLCCCRVVRLVFVVLFWFECVVCSVVIVVLVCFCWYLCLVFDDMCLHVMWKKIS